MELAALIVSLGAVVAAAYAGYQTFVQAQAAQQAAEHAATANETADEALRLARDAAEMERDRRHAEQYPRLTAEALPEMRKHQEVRLVNHGPVAYDSITITVDLGEYGWALKGMIDHHDPAFEVPELPLPHGLLVGAEAVIKVNRTDVDAAGRVHLLATCRRDHDEWVVSVPLELRRPPVFYSI